MAKIKTTRNINIRANSQVIEIESNVFIEVSEEMAIYFCNEDIEAMSIEAQKQHRRLKKAIRATEQEETAEIFIDYTFI